MMKILKDLGTRRAKSGHLRRWALVRCDCSLEYETLLYNIKSGKTTCCKNCRIKARETHREDGKIRLYRIWGGMKYRCRNKKSKDYKYYGAKGIDVCSEWDDYAVFAKWARANGYQEHLTIDRKNSKANYEVSNCRWITHSANSSRKGVTYDMD